MADDGAYPDVDEHSDAPGTVSERIERFRSELDLRAVLRAAGRASYVELDATGAVVTRHLTY